MDRRALLKAPAGIWLAGTASRASAQAAAAPPSKTNEVIQQARQAAIEVLKPSAKELEHGLELHEASLVFDSYGFSPRAAID